MAAKPDQVRASALALPETEEHAHFGRPSFRTRKRIFATLPDGESAVVKLPLEDQATLLESHPAVFSVDGWAHQGWTHVDLRAVDRDMLDELIELAWSRIATKRALRTLEERSR